MLKPRQIADRMIKAMDEAAKDTWKQYEKEVRDEDRANTKRLVWAHVVNGFARRQK